VKKVHKLSLAAGALIGAIVIAMVLLFSDLLSRNKVNRVDESTNSNSQTEKATPSISNPKPGLLETIKVQPGGAGVYEDIEIRVGKLTPVPVKGKKESTYVIQGEIISTRTGDRTRITNLKEGASVEASGYLITVHKVLDNRAEFTVSRTTK
jgi:hypothetical protein